MDLFCGKSAAPKPQLTLTGGCSSPGEVITGRREGPSPSKGIRCAAATQKMGRTEKLEGCQRQTRRVARGLACCPATGGMATRVWTTAPVKQTVKKHQVQVHGEESGIGAAASGQNRSANSSRRCIHVSPSVSAGTLRKSASTARVRSASAVASGISK